MECGPNQQILVEGKKRGLGYIVQGKKTVTLTIDDCMLSLGYLCQVLSVNYFILSL